MSSVINCRLMSCRFGARCLLPESSKAARRSRKPNCISRFRFVWPRGRDSLAVDRGAQMGVCLCLINFGLLRGTSWACKSPATTATRAAAAPRVLLDLSSADMPKVLDSRRVSLHLLFFSTRTDEKRLQLQRRVLSELALPRRGRRLTTDNHAWLRQLINCQTRVSARELQAEDGMRGGRRGRRRASIPPCRQPEASYICTQRQSSIQ